MANPIVFRKEIKQGRQYDPRHNFALSTIASEIRYDPLTGDSGRLCHFLFNSAPPTDLSALIANSAVNCPFCPGAVDKVTPRFLEDMLPEGRLRHGAAVLFPNLFPYDDVSAVAVISERHFHPLEDIPKQIIVDGITIARKFLRRIEAGHRESADPGYGIVVWNYLPPAGASQVHPHMQVVHTTNPGNTLRRELAAEKAYREKYGRTYVADLLAMEQAEGARWIGKSGSVSWYTPYVPTGLLGDCVGVFPGRSTLTALSDAEIADFAAGLRQVLRYFAGLGLWSFNLMFFPASMGSTADEHWLTARIVPRFYLNPVLHVSDVAYPQLLMGERLAMVYPEQTAASLRDSMGFGGNH